MRSCMSDTHSHDLMPPGGMVESYLPSSVGNVAFWQGVLSFEKSLQRSQSFAELSICTALCGKLTL